MIKVIMYTKDNCPSCNRAKMLLIHCPIDLEVEYRHIEKKDKYRKEFDDYGFMSTPSFVIGEDKIEGFNEGKLMEVIGL